ncbi:unnamed protein product [Linum trigynum]|uniref:Uncharacterized protein n=1 Tax=Linum trigynum TaxID=586398 RepID=A0AAV2CF96_9ROSI
MASESLAPAGGSGGASSEPTVVTPNCIQRRRETSLRQVVAAEPLQNPQATTALQNPQATTFRHPDLSRYNKSNHWISASQ